MRVKIKRHIGFEGELTETVFYGYDQKGLLTTIETIDNNSVQVDKFINHYNQDDLLVKTEYFIREKLNHYTVFKYDECQNCIQEIGYDEANEVQGSETFEFDKQNRRIKDVELTAEGEIWEWKETLYPDDESIIYLVKDSDGQVNFKNIENLKTGGQEHYDGRGVLQSVITKTFDSKGRVVNSTTKNNAGHELHKSNYTYKDGFEIWEYYSNNVYVKSEESQYDDQGNLTMNVRKDERGKCFEWRRYEYDEHDHQILSEGGIELGNVTYRTIFEIEYEKE